MLRLGTENKPPGKRIFIVDNHPLVREWLTSLVDRQPGWKVCGEAEGAPVARQLIDEKKPDIVIMDLSLAEGSGIQLIKDIRFQAPKMAIMVLSMHDESLYAERVLRAGARGYVMKREPTEKIMTGIRQVLEGKLFVSKKFAAALTERLMEGKDAGRSPVAQLSDRELEVFDMMGQGLGTRQIAELLHISIKTVQVYCTRIKEKLKLANATELLRETIRWHESRQE